MGDWVLIIPVKRLALAKTRLSVFAGGDRVALALAFATDTMSALRPRATRCEESRS